MTTEGDLHGGERRRLLAKETFAKPADLTTLPS